MRSLTARNRWTTIAVVAVCVVAFVGVSTRYVLLRADRRATEQSVDRLTKTTREALELLRSVRDTRSSADSRNDTVTQERDQVRAVATLLHADLDRARAETTSSAIGAYVSGAQANNVARCLTGVSQALNQLSVGDTGSIRSLQAVEAPCREAGMAT